MTNVAPPVGLIIDDRVFHVRCDDPGDRDAVRAALSGFTPAPAERGPDVTCTVERIAPGVWAVTSTGGLVQQASTLEDALLAVEWQLVTDVLAHQTDRFHLHGAALADPTGVMTVLVLGESGAGKTTLTLALIAAGFRPYADDVVLVDADTLTVARFPRAFHVDGQTRRLVAPLFGERTWEVAGLPPGNCLPSVWAEAPAPVGAIVLPKSRDHARPLLVGLTVADAAMALLSCTTTLERAPALALRAAARLTASAPTYALHAGPLPVTADAVATLVAGLRAGPSPGR